MANGRNVLKLDVTTLEITNSPSLIALLNFNVPADHEDQAGAFRDIAAFVEANFGATQGPRVSYQITASYVLTHRVTQDSRVWTGSFNPGAAAHRSSLSGPEFSNFQGRQSFLHHATACTEPGHVLSVLDWKDSDSDWQFSEVESFIFSFQVRLPHGHGFLARYRLGISAGRNHNRRRVTLPHPW